MVRQSHVQQDNGQIIGFDEPNDSHHTSTSKSDYVSHKESKSTRPAESFVGHSARDEYRLNQERARHTFQLHNSDSVGVTQQHAIERKPAGGAVGVATTAQASYTPHVNDLVSQQEYHRNKNRGRQVDDWTKGTGELSTMQSSYKSNYAVGSGRPAAHDAQPRNAAPHYNIINGDMTCEDGQRPAQRVSYEKVRQAQEASRGPYNIISNMNA